MYRWQWGYRAYWSEIIVELLLNSDEELSIDDIAQRTSITHSDVMYTYVRLLQLNYIVNDLVQLHNFATFQTLQGSSCDMPFRRNY